jgi:hypothetical protein
MSSNDEPALWSLGSEVAVVSLLWHLFPILVPAERRSVVLPGTCLLTKLTYKLREPKSTAKNVRIGRRRMDSFHFRQPLQRRTLSTRLAARDQDILMNKTLISSIWTLEGWLLQLHY